jgi:hypothetical protein
MRLSNLNSAAADGPESAAHSVAAEARHSPGVSVEEDDEHASRATVLLLVDAEAPRSRPGLTSAFAGNGTVREAVSVDHADCCILMDASAPIGPDNVAGSDEIQRCRGAALMGLVRLPLLVHTGSGR